jgi:hypothetical protein
MSEMERTRRIISLALVCALVSLGSVAQAQRTATGYSRYQIGQIINRVQSDTDRFRATFTDAVNQSNIDNTRREQNADVYLNDLTSAVSQLRSRFDRRQAVAADAQLVLDRATLVENFMRRNQFGGQVDTDWSTVRNDLNNLATAYGIRWRGNGGYNRNNPNGGYGNNGGYNNNNGGYGNNNGGYGNNNGGYGNNGYNTDARLTGTFRLDPSRSDDPRVQAQNAVRSVRWSDRQRVLESLSQRLTPPDSLAIQRRGNQVTIASTRAPQIDFTADGTTRTEQTPNGRTVRVSANLSGDQLMVSTTGNTGNDFNVTFRPIDNGRSLEVTRRISDVSLNVPVTVRSVYTRTADVAQFDVYQGGGYGNNPNGGSYPTTTTTASGQFIVPDGATLVATLDNNLSTSTANEGDTFSMTVREPAQFAGARIDGHVSSISRSGRVSGRSSLTFNFDRITTSDGRSYAFSGFVDTVRATNGETVRVDNEGTVQDSNQTTRTEQRAAIGTGIGAIIGAIAGGGKGAAIGAILGAGAGAGSVYAQGRDDLNLTSGSEVTIRASSPRVQ